MDLNRINLAVGIVSHTCVIMKLIFYEDFKLLTGLRISAGKTAFVKVSVVFFFEIFEYTLLLVVL